jgi:hypothetical protein
MLRCCLHKQQLSAPISGSLFAKIERDLVFQNVWKKIDATSTAVVNKYTYFLFGQR